MHICWTAKKEFDWFVFVLVYSPCEISQGIVGDGRSHGSCTLPMVPSMRRFLSGDGMEVSPTPGAVKTRLSPRSPSHDNPMTAVAPGVT